MAAVRRCFQRVRETRGGRLAVVELKAMRIFICRCRAWIIWARVQWHHGRGEFLKFGYFGGREMSAESPPLFLVAPALRAHPATDVIRRYISPGIEWAFVGIDQR